MRRCWTIAAALIVFAGIVPAGRGADDADLNKKAVEAVKQFTRSAKAKDADGMMKVAGTPWSHSAEWDGDKTFHKPAELRKYFQNSIDDIRKSATRIPAEVFGGGDFSDLLDALKESKAGDDTVRLLRAVARKGDYVAFIGSKKEGLFAVRVRDNKAVVAGGLLFR
jgi:hypothetical protein